MTRPRSREPRPYDLPSSPPGPWSLLHRPPVLPGNRHRAFYGALLPSLRCPARHIHHRPACQSPSVNLSRASADTVQSAVTRLSSSQLRRHRSLALFRFRKRGRRERQTITRLLSSRAPSRIAQVHVHNKVAARHTAAAAGRSGKQAGLRVAKATRNFLLDGVGFYSSRWFNGQRGRERLQSPRLYRP